MRSRAAVVLALLGVLSLLLAAPAQAGYARKPPLRILVVGDSVSHGIGGDWTWRHWLWDEFRRQQVPVDFVGPRTSVATGYGTRYERTWSWDSGHAAMAGATTEYFQPQMKQLLVDYTPDVLIVQLGLNDLNHGATPTVVISRLKQLLSTAWSVRPRMRVVLAQITNLEIASVDAASKKVNDAMAAWAVGKQVEISHNRTGEGPGTVTWSTRYTFDKGHPNATGATLYAHRFAQALNRLGLLPQAPTVFHGRTWAPDMRPTVTPISGGVTVSWKRTTAEVAVNALAVRADGRLVSNWIPIGVRGDTKTLTLRLGHGTHRFQIVPKRGDMVGAAGGVVNATVA